MCPKCGSTHGQAPLPAKGMKGALGYSAVQLGESPTHQCGGCGNKYDSTPAAKVAKGRRTSMSDQEMASRAARVHQETEFEGHASAAEAHLKAAHAEHNALHGGSSSPSHFEEAMSHLNRAREHNSRGAYGTRNAHLELAKGHTTLGASAMAGRSRHAEPAREALEHASHT